MLTASQPSHVVVVSQSIIKGGSMVLVCFEPYVAGLGIAPVWSFRKA